MPNYTNHRKEYTSVHDKPILSPVTPAVTGINYPSGEDASTDIESSQPRGWGQQFYTLPNVAASALDDAIEPPSSSSLDDVWGAIRQEKQRKMAKERPKVQSLEEITQELLTIEQQPALQIPVMESHGSVPKSLKKQKSISNFRESTDRRSIVATFDLPPDVSKQNIHISFQRNRLIVTWEFAELTEWMEDDILYRERTERHFHRTLPLPEGTRFEEIHAQMTGRGLILRYPNMRCSRADGHSRSGES